MGLLGTRWESSRRQANPVALVTRDPQSGEAGPDLVTSQIEALDQPLFRQELTVLNASANRVVSHEATP